MGKKQTKPSENRPLTMWPPERLDAELASILPAVENERTPSRLLKTAERLEGVFGQQGKTQ